MAELRKFTFCLSFIFKGISHIKFRDLTVRGLTLALLMRSTGRAIAKCEFAGGFDGKGNRKSFLNFHSNTLMIYIY